MMIMRSAVVTAALAGAALGLAGSASAEPPNGTYTEHVTDGGGYVPDGTTRPLTMTPCGSGCIHVTAPETGSDFGNYRLQGNTWTGNTDEHGSVMAFDQDSLNGTESYPNGQALKFYLTKDD